MQISFIKYLAPEQNDMPRIRHQLRLASIISVCEKPPFTAFGFEEIV